jgi:hemerythrin-like domain-containing protein
VKPIGPLMKEHRVIERVVALLRDELDDIARTGRADNRLLDFAVDFFRTYADRCHHGKEEDILFRELKKKPLSAEDSTVIDVLIEEHVFARSIVKQLSAAKEGKAAGPSRGDIVDCLETLIAFYPSHIEKEDKHFFFPSLRYLSQREQDAMLAEFEEFDAKLVHEIYGNMITKIEKRKKEANGP